MACSSNLEKRTFHRHGRPSRSEFGLPRCSGKCGDGSDCKLINFNEFFKSVDGSLQKIAKPTADDERTAIRHSIWVCGCEGETLAGGPCRIGRVEKRRLVTEAEALAGQGVYHWEVDASCFGTCREGHCPKEPRVVETRRELTNPIEIVPGVKGYSGRDYVLIETLECKCE
jgi:hypothetical protein